MTRRNLSGFAGVIVMVASVAAVIWTVASDDEGLDALRSVDTQAIAALLGLLALGLPIQAYRYRLAVQEAAGTTIPAWAWFRLFVLGRFLNALLPQAGNAYRAVRLKEDYAISLTTFLSGFMAFTWLSSLLNMAATFVLVLVLEPGLEFAGIPGLALLVVLGAVTAATPPALLLLLRRSHIERGFWGWAYRRSEEMVGGAVRVSRSPPTVIRFILAGLVGLAITSAAFWVAFQSLDLEASVSTVVLFYSLQQLGTYVSVTPGNLGIQELFSGGLAVQLGVGLTGGLLVASLVRLTAYATLLTIGLALGGLRILTKIRETERA